ncbi:hypothetical protein E6Q11_03845 [Candidatus Dojkabacteria bacterium]|uniref:Uncharacterized protein n=1 Tax=Candidatus Dojkabacteria bacterium TaxID=2099670 RepID=A0A5C7J5R9_9BACT|nr:MAG: hypothetical protein E6Q11_03845 [Candidatus Dojkabacteria bacterium]
MKYLACACIFLTTANAFALGEINCSSAKGYLQRVEKEIWGANSIIWKYGDLSYSIAHPERALFQVTLNEESKRWLHGNTHNGTYTIEAEVIMRDGSNTAPTYFWLLCEQWSNDAMD